MYLARGCSLPITARLLKSKQQEAFTSWSYIIIWWKDRMRWGHLARISLGKRKHLQLPRSKIPMVWKAGVLSATQYTCLLWPRSTQLVSTGTYLTARLAETPEDTWTENWSSDTMSGRQILNSMYPTRIQRIKDIPENVFKKHEELVGVLRHGLSQEGEISDGSIYSKRYWKPASAHRRVW